MSPTTTRTAPSKIRRLILAAAPLTLAATAQAAVPGIAGPTFNLVASDAYISQPDGARIYSWGYGCTAGTAPSSFMPTGITNGFCGTMQIPGPTLIVREGQTVTVNLTNNLPIPAGNTSILFPGFQVTATGAVGQPNPACTNAAVVGPLTTEAAPGCTISYSFTASSPGTHAYYSGTQSDLQIEMGLYGAIVVLPANFPANCSAGLAAANVQVELTHGEQDFRLSPAAYDHPGTCYDREYLLQFAEMDPNIHSQVLAQLFARVACTATTRCPLQVATEPYHPAYFLVNGRSMPDDMDANYAVAFPHQPYNANPHAHPGEQVLLRVIGQGRWPHPFHEDGNHVRVLARDGNLILSPSNSGDLAGPVLFTTTTTPGMAFDGIFYWTGRGLNWDAYGHSPGFASIDPQADPPCYADANGYFTANSPGFTPAQYAALNYYEWCADHNKPLQTAPFGGVQGGGPTTLPDPSLLTNGPWYSGSPYLGPDATARATGPTSVFAPSDTQANPPNERGFAFMWHSHNAREMTTNNVFPGGMLMMMLVDSREFTIDESQ